jgi:hypothetical protein
MTWSICGADATTHLKIVATALLAASIVAWIGIAARTSAASSAASVAVPARPASVPVQPPKQPSMTAISDSYSL